MNRIDIMRISAADIKERREGVKTVGIFHRFRKTGGDITVEQLKQEPYEQKYFEEYQESLAEIGAADAADTTTAN